MEKQFADLHTHTAHSREANNYLDLRLRNYLEAKAANPGLCLIGVVDHDTLNHVEPMYRAQRAYAQDELPALLPGIEISCVFDYFGKIIQTHLLGYFPKLMGYNPEELKRVKEIMEPVVLSTLNGKMKKNFDFRIAHFKDNGILPEGYDTVLLAEKMKERYEKDCSMIREHEFKFGDIIDWPHPSSDKLIIDVLIEDGILFSEREGKSYVDRRDVSNDKTKIKRLASILEEKDGLSPEKAFEKADKLQGSCHGSYADDFVKVSTQSAILAIKRAGGVPVLAHPMVSFKKFPGGIDSFLTYCHNELVPLGLMGLEAFYPNQAEFTLKLIMFCEDNGLIVTGGSDDHQDGRNFIGEAGSRCPLEYVEKILDM